LMLGISESDLSTQKLDSYSSFQASDKSPLFVIIPPLIPSVCPEKNGRP
jgi:hypothetical protein